MIASLEGRLLEKTPGRVVLEVGGVGYDVQIPLSTFTELPAEGKPLALRIYTHVREDALQLFGFRTLRERVVFELLIRTTGVGPKLAQGILSGIAADVLLETIAQGDVARLCRVPGVGRKTAERIVVELRDRVTELAGVSSRDASLRPASVSSRGGANAVIEQALSALLNLGYPQTQAKAVVQEAAGELGEAPALEGLLRAALRKLSR